MSDYHVMILAPSDVAAVAGGYSEGGEVCISYCCLAATPLALVKRSGEILVAQ